MSTSPDIVNKLYYGDNLEVLRAFEDECVDLIYLDPPFNSNRNYNVIFRDESGNRSDAQQLAFEDTWHWGPRVERHYRYLSNSGDHGGKVPEPLSAIVGALRMALGENQMMAYIVEMAIRLVEMRRVLRPTGSLFLHCDPTASHYLKIVLDAIFGAKHFRNDISWCYTGPSNVKRWFPRKHDNILFYVCSEEASFYPESVRIPYKDSFTMGGKNSFAAKNRLGDYRSGATEQLQRGKVVEDYWVDIPSLSVTKERLGYPTQKPLALLERIISAASRPGDVVLDPFCGCGTAVEAAQQLGRHWVGVDITYLAIGVVRRRMEEKFKQLGEIDVVNRPTELEGVRQMALSIKGRYDFQWWALDAVGAMPRGDTRKKGADGGVDGVITFTDGDNSLKRVIVSVKSGKPRLDDVRVLRAVVERQDAAMGVLVTLNNPTGPMKQDAAAAGFWSSDYLEGDYPKVQIATADDLIRGRGPVLPRLRRTPYLMPEKVRQAEALGEELWGKAAVR